MKFHSGHLKTALMAYYRFKKQCICADEVFNSDIMVDTGSEIIEIECKTSKSDLKADSKKSKHERYKTPNKYSPNKFYICVPTELVEDAKKWTEETNPNYGVIELSERKYLEYYRYSRRWENMLYFVKKAKAIHKEYRNIKDYISLRLCSILINKNIEVYQQQENVT